MSHPRILSSVTLISTLTVGWFATSCGNPTQKTTEQAALPKQNQPSKLAPSSPQMEVPPDRSPAEVVASLRREQEASRAASMQGTFERVGGGVQAPPSLAELTEGQTRVVFDDFESLEFQQENVVSVTKPSASIKMYDSLPKQQNERGWCTSFALTGALENLARQRAKRPNLSEVHHWSHYEMYQTWESAKAATTHWITEEKTWPYRALRPANVESKGIAKATSVTRLKNKAEVFAGLADKLPVLLSTEVTPKWYNSNGYIVAAGEGIGGHALEIVGYKFDKKSPGGGYFTFKNSWGRSSWGDHGYGYLPFSYCARFYCSFIRIDGLDLRKSTEPDSQPTPAPRPNTNRDGKIMERGAPTVPS